ncbi:MAG: acetyl-CoA hydrolase/transferase C-terminal domain-containing protein [Cognaticolwellia sp.]
MQKTSFTNNVESTVDEILNRCGHHVKLAAPLGLGKPNILLNALYQRVKVSPKLRLTIYTALSLQTPQTTNALQSRFLKPFLTRHFGDKYPELDYVIDRNKNCLPDNIVVHEFYFSSGSQLNVSAAQQDYICQNYTHVARDLVAANVNLLLQQVVRRENKISLSCNPDVSLELIDRMEQENKALFTVGVLNNELPYLGGDAEVGQEVFNLLLEDGNNTELFAIPRESVSAVDHAIGLHASTLVKDGGTLQIGIGALSDAIVNALMLRQQDNSSYLKSLASLDVDCNSALVQEVGGLTPFTQGLYGATEMVMDGFMHLRQAGILKRLVFDDLRLQQLLDNNTISNPLAAGDANKMVDLGLVAKQLSDVDLSWLKRFGLLEKGAKIAEKQLSTERQSISCDLSEKTALAEFDQLLSGKPLQGGRYLEGAFLLGSKPLYHWLCQLKEDDWSGLWMRSVLHTNELLGGKETLDRIQRKDARFFNTCMMQTLLGAAVSDALESGQVVSGVGGQYNFVAMAHALDSGRSILMLRATRTKANKLQSNLLWNYGHTTIPRHLRDIVITEYGIADLRGQSDQEVIKRLLAISDARFQLTLLASAKAAGKIASDFIIPNAWRLNLPEKLIVLKQNPNFAIYPFGCDFNEIEQQLITALQSLEAATISPFGKLSHLIRSLLPAKIPAQAYPHLARMGWSQSDESVSMSFKDKLLSRMLVRHLPF